jgi:glycerate kinase
VPGAELVAEAVGLDAALGAAALAITGEGRFDSTSLAGKVTGHVLSRGKALGVPVALVVGDADRDRAGDVPLLTLLELAGDADAALRETASLASSAAEALARRL